MEEKIKMSYRLMVPELARTCLSAQSALSGKPNIEAVPLGAKLPLIPGSRIVLSTEKLGAKLHQPSCDFDRTYPSDVYISNEYRCLHDPHLRHYFVHPTTQKRLRKTGFITDDKKVVCSLKEYNLYRQYLKHLSIEYFNKIQREDYEKELESQREKIKSAIRKKQQDPDNPITRRINRARKARNIMEKALFLKGKKMDKISEEEHLERSRRKEQEMRRRIKEEIVRERKRERLKKIKIMHMEEERLMREELLFYKHQEEVYRSKELEERKKSVLIEKQRKLTEKYERKKRFHLLKVAEFHQLIAEKAETRQKNVEFWKRHFEEKLKRQHRDFQSIMTQHQQARDERNRKIEESLKARGWTGFDRIYPKRKEPQLKKKKSKKKKKKKGIWGQSELSSLGFHSAVVPDDLLELIWDGESCESSESSSDDDTNSDEHMSGGDAHPCSPPPPKLSLSEQARHICDDVITSERARHLVEQVIVRTQELEVASQEVVDQAVRISRDVLIPMLRRYEERTGEKIPDGKIIETLREICSVVLDEEEDQVAPLLDLSTDEGKTTVKAGKKDSNVRFILSNTEIPLPHHKSNRPPTPKQRMVKFMDESCDSFDMNLLTESDSQLLLMDTIKSLAKKVVDQVFESTSSELHVSREEMEYRIANLASSVVEEIVTVETVEEVHASLSPMRADSSCSSNDSHGSLERKISSLARAMAADMDTSDGISSSDMSSLAHHVVLSTLVSHPENAPIAGTSSDPMVNEISNRLMKELALERDSTTCTFGSDVTIELEQKISKLALNVVHSVLKGTSASSSYSSMSSQGRELKITEITAEIITSMLRLKKFLPPDVDLTNQRREDSRSRAEQEIHKILNLQALNEAPREVFKSLREEDIKRLSRVVTKKIVPSRCTSSAISSGINELAVALTEQAITAGGVDHSSSSQLSSTSLENAVRRLADTVVQETINKTATVNSDTQSALSSGIDLLVDELADEVLARAENLSNASALSSGIDHIASEITAEALDKGHDIGSSTESALDSGTEILASRVLREALDQHNTCNKTLNNFSMLNTSSESSLNSAIKDLSENIAALALDEALGKVNNPSSADSAMSSLAAHIARVTLGEEKTSMSELESALSSGVSKIVIDTISNRVLEEIEKKNTDHLRNTNRDQLKKEIVTLVKSLIDARASTGSYGTAEAEANVAQTQIRQNASSATTSGQSAVSSAISALACDVIKNATALPLEAGNQENDDENNSAESKENSKNLPSSTNNGAKKQKTPSKSKSQGHGKSPYESNFASWRIGGGQTGKASGSSDKDARTIKVYGTQFNLDNKTSKAGRSAPPKNEDWKNEMNEVLDDLAARIVESVVSGKMPTSGSNSDTLVDLSKSKSVEKMVESLALGVVTSLLGIDLSNVTSGETSPDLSTNNSPREGASKSEEDENLPKPSAGTQSLIDTWNNLERPSAPIPGQRHHKTNDESNYDKLTSLLASPSREKPRITTPCEDNAQEHPHRVLSPKGAKYGQKKSRRSRD